MSSTNYFPSYIGEYHGGSAYQLDGSRSDYVLTGNYSSLEPNGSYFFGWQISASNSDGYFLVPDGSRVYFNDGTVALDIDSLEVAGQAYRLYQAAFARTPDLAGVAYHINDIENNGLSLHQIANNFVASPEFRTKYGDNPTDEEYVSVLYQNVLNRTAADFEVDYYVNRLASGTFDRADALVSFSESPENVMNTASQLNEMKLFFLEHPSGVKEIYH